MYTDSADSDVKYVYFHRILKDCSVNGVMIRGRSGEIAEMLEHLSVDIFWLQKTRFRTKSFRMIKGNCLGAQKCRSCSHFLG